MSDVFEQWKRDHTFYCEGLSARITPEQCDYNRSHTNGDWGHSGWTKYPCEPCERCEDYDRLKATVKKRLPQPQEGKTMTTVGECRGCHAPRVVLPARRLCGKCLEGYRNGDLEEANGGYTWVCDPLPDHVLQERADAKEREENQTAVEMLRKVKEESAQRTRQEIPAEPVERPKPKPLRTSTIAQKMEEEEAIERRLDEKIEEERGDSWPSFAKPSNVLAEAPILPGLNLVRHEKARAVSGTPSVRISTGKNSMSICMNAAATKALGLESGDYVDVYKDTEAKVVAFRLLDKPTDGNSLRLMGKSYDRKFSAKAVLADIDIPDKASHYAIREADVAGYYLIDFKEKVA